MALHLFIPVLPDCMVLEPTLLFLLFRAFPKEDSMLGYSHSVSLASATGMKAPRPTFTHIDRFKMQEQAFEVRKN